MGVLSNLKDSSFHYDFCRGGGRRLQSESRIRSESAHPAQLQVAIMAHVKDARLDRFPSTPSAHWAHTQHQLPQPLSLLAQAAAVPLDEREQVSPIFGTVNHAQPPAYHL
jgi:hypothetical protein